VPLQKLKVRRFWWRGNPEKKLYRLKKEAASTKKEKSGSIDNFSRPKDTVLPFRKQVSETVLQVVFVFRVFWLKMIPFSKSAFKNKGVLKKKYMNFKKGH